MPCYMLVDWIGNGRVEYRETRESFAIVFLHFTMIPSGQWYGLEETRAHGMKIGTAVQGLVGDDDDTKREALGSWIWASSQKGCGMIWKSTGWHTGYLSPCEDKVDKEERNEAHCYCNYCYVP
jgi:hypothetical protein